MTLPPVDAFEFVVDGAPVLVDDERLTLLEVLRDRLGVRSVKDGCSPRASAVAARCWWTGSPGWPA